MSFNRSAMFFLDELSSPDRSVWLFRVLICSRFFSSISRSFSISCLSASRFFELATAHRISPSSALASLNTLFADSTSRSAICIRFSFSLKFASNSVSFSFILASSLFAVRTREGSLFLSIFAALSSLFTFSTATSAFLRSDFLVSRSFFRLRRFSPPASNSLLLIFRTSDFILFLSAFADFRLDSASTTPD